MGRAGIPFYVLFWIIVFLRLMRPAWLGDVDLALSIGQGVMLVVLYVTLGVDAKMRIEALEAKLEETNGSQSLDKRRPMLYNKEGER